MPASRRQDWVILQARIMLFIPFAQQGLPCRFGSEKQRHAGMRLPSLTCGCFYINKKGAKKGCVCVVRLKMKPLCLELKQVSRSWETWHALGGSPSRAFLSCV